MAGFRLLSNAVPKVAGQVFSRKYIMLGRLVTHWEDIVGAGMAHKTQPVKIRYIKPKTKKDKATATLDIAASTADATLLHYKKDLILERINQIFGDRWVSAIRFVPQASTHQENKAKIIKKPLSPTDKKTLQDTLSSVSDPDIKEKLENLGKAILQDKPS